ncbi:MAG: cupin domain-containing protein [Opitutaceae bacterium]|nr:cupin domain-containing protein [Opitutaceae bacterium]
MKIMRAPTLATKRGPAEYFTGTVWLDDLTGGAPSGVKVARVSFEPGARTAWHSHPHGQLLHIVSGIARIGREGQGPVEVQAGDSVWFEAGERHWHGAAPGRAMVHLAVQQADQAGNAATWFEHVIDADYGRTA